MDIFQIVLFFTSVVGGLIAAISGFGIGSVLTPVVSTYTDTRLAVAIVSIPHFIGTLLRFARVRKHVNRPVAFSFGAASAIGGLSGAVLHTYASGPTLNDVLGTLLIFAGLMGVIGVASRLRMSGPWAWIGGFISAALGGLVGNQGGIRSAAMLGFQLTKESFIATATAIALVVDAARMPVYFATEGGDILRLWPILAVSTIGVVAGTLAGTSLLQRIPEKIFKRLVSILILGLGFYMLFRSPS